MAQEAGPAKSDQLKKQTEILSLTMDAVFTEEQAKDVVAGKITDSYLVKMKLDIDGNTGMILVIASSFRKSILDLYCVVGNATIYRRLRPFSDFAQLSQDLADIAKANAIDKPLSDLLGQTLLRVFTKDKLEEFLILWQKKNPSRLSEFAEPALQASTNASKIKIQAEVDKISYGRFRFQNPMQGLVFPIAKQNTEIPKEEGKDSTGLDLTNLGESSGEKTPLERQIDQFRKGFQRELPLKTYISPVSGVDFDSLIEGQEILFTIPMDSSETKSIGNLLGWMEEDGSVSKQPIPAKYLGIASVKNEYHIFAQGPNGILFHSQEEQPVKVGVVNPSLYSKKGKPKGSSSSPEDSKDNTGTIIALGVVMCILGAIAYFLIG